MENEKMVTVEEAQVRASERIAVALEGILAVLKDFQMKGDAYYAAYPPPPPAAKP